MLFAHIDVIDGNLDYKKDCFVATEDQRVVYLGQKEPEGDFGEVYDGRGKLLMSGLYNAHAHSTMTLLRGYAENMALQDWLFNAVFPFEDLITNESALPATQLAIAEMLRFGVVSFSDMYFFDDPRAQAVLDSGIKCNLCRSISSFDPEQHYRDHDAFSVNEHLIDDLHGAGNGRLLVDMCLHSEYTTTPRMVQEVAAYTQERGLGMQVHVSETKSEVEECKGRHNGMTPPAYLASLGVFDVPTTAAHCVWLEGDDYDLLREKDVTVATCPASNCKLGSGVMAENVLFDHGVRVALGTDGVASNNSHDMFRDMYLLALVGRGATCNPVGITPRRVLQSATYNGAYAQQRSDCGALKVGNKADLVVLDLDVPWMQPVSDMCTNVVYSANGSEVVLTMVDGKVLYRDGQWPTIDVERAMAQTAEYRANIAAEAAKRAAEKAAAAQQGE